ncbi:arsenite efflux transporter metallochaperone ArsD [Cutibacterium sp. WCA-380-WT-3A]|uniref:Arsenite efflux transporter metallochaperone ArsD n=1 Tax=Cutibacterium porci TaxID=2605781 RepID=A0A7K0J901_9ACTN|nr:arsenite efflux transporter metallochaperone ArsD [Cutibacterium porci]MSS46313.1 arsenite efflux transporter metallochaperone ArsD [Cutibacterium porci]
MPVIRVFEPALCCNTGVCGPNIDQELVDFTAAVNALRAQGIDVQRANLATEPAQFAEHPVVAQFLQTAGSEGLPLTLVDDVTVLTGRHPRRDELERYAGLTPAQDSQCCNPAAGQSTSDACCNPQPITLMTSTSCCSSNSAAEAPSAGCCGQASSTGCC